LGSSLFCVGKQLLQVSSTQRIDSPRFLDRINRMGRMFACRSEAGQAISHEIEASGLRVQQESPLKVRYRDQVVGDFFADLLIEDELIVELKSVERLAKIHEAQLVNYLVATGIEVGLLINFGSTGVDVKRKYRTAKEKQ
jgi:GxxExxY protein